MTPIKMFLSGLLFVLLNPLFGQIDISPIKDSTQLSTTFEILIEGENIDSIKRELMIWVVSHSNHNQPFIYLDSKNYFFIGRITQVHTGGEFDKYLKTHIMDFVTIISIELKPYKVKITFSSPRVSTVNSESSFLENPRRIGTEQYLQSVRNDWEKFERLLRKELSN